MVFLQLTGRGRDARGHSTSAVQATSRNVISKTLRPGGGFLQQKTSATNTDPGDLQAEGILSLARDRPSVR